MYELSVNVEITPVSLPANKSNLEGALNGRPRMARTSPLCTVIGSYLRRQDGRSWHDDYFRFHERRPYLKSLAGK